MNWRKALEKEKGFDKHKCSDTHKQAIIQYFDILNSTRSPVKNLLSEISGEIKLKIARYFVKFLKTEFLAGNLYYLEAGTWILKTNMKEKILNLQCGWGPNIVKWLQKKQKIIIAQRFRTKW